MRPREVLDHLQAEIERIHDEFRAVYRETPGAEAAPSHWTYSGRALRWHVSLFAVVEPDVDIEVGTRTVVVRGRVVQDEADITWVSVLPIPAAFGGVEPTIRFDEGYLEISFTREITR